jgi:hypothetical protein
VEQTLPKKIEISDAAHDKLVFAARIANLSLSEAVDRLVGVPEAPAVPTVDPSSSADEIPISVKYLGKRVAGFLDLAADRVRITEAPDPSLIGSYRSPSQAAMETVRVLNPARQHPQTNGWRFWYANDGQLIERHRRRM